MSRSKDFAALADACAIISNICDIGLSSLEHERIAKEIALKLFPPMAKPLQWLGFRSGDYRVFEIETDAHVPQIRNMCGHVPRYDPIGDACATQDKAKAACEAHHQTQFLEMLA